MLPENKSLKLGKKGLALIKSFEGYHTKVNDGSGDCVAYWDKAGGIWTIGYGVTEGVYKGMRLSETAAEKMFLGELAKHENFVRTMVTVPLDQNEFDALVSFCYNLGPGNLKKLIANRLNKGKRKETADAMLLYIGARVKNQSASVKKGLTRRRKAERELFLTWTPKDVRETKPGSLIERIKSWWAALGLGALVSWNTVEQVSKFVQDNAGWFLLGGAAAAFLTYKTIEWSLQANHTEFIEPDAE